MSKRKNGDTDNGTALKYRLGMQVVFGGLASILAVVLFSMTQFESASDVAAVTGSAAGVIGTMVGAFFGVSTGSAASSEGKAEAEAAREKTTDVAIAAAANLDPAMSGEFLQQLGIFTDDAGGRT